MKIEMKNIAARRCGKWSVSPFTINASEAAMFNMFKERWQWVESGDYWRLEHAERGVIMSNVPMEVRTNMPIINAARDHVLINGLGLGMVPTALLENQGVSKITVVEIDKDVIALTSPMFMAALADGRMEIIHGDCYEHKPSKGDHYGAVWHDVWDDISDDNLRQMSKLKRKYAAIADWQGCWAEPECRKQREKLVQLCKRHGVPRSRIANTFKEVFGEHEA